MRFSLITPSFLGNYHGAASDREKKIVRMIESVMTQTFQDFELIIVADGCDKTIEIVEPYFYEYLPKIRLIKVPKQKNWSGLVRNAGIKSSNGEIITYIDIDDMLGANHLQIIHDNFGTYDWVYADHLVYSNKEKDFVPYKTNIDRKGQCGTSSVSHKRDLGVYWTNNGYEHDFVLINALKAASSNFGRIPQTEYKVCHVPYPLVDY